MTLGFPLDLGHIPGQDALAFAVQNMLDAGARTTCVHTSVSRPLALTFLKSPSSRPPRSLMPFLHLSASGHYCTCRTNNRHIARCLNCRGISMAKEVAIFLHMHRHSVCPKNEIAIVICQSQVSRRHFMP